MTGPPPFGEPVPGNRWDRMHGRRPARPPRVSVIVVHYDQPAQLRRTLRALAAQTHPAQRLEVIVVDDGSPVGPTVPDGVRLLRQADRGVRPGAARNLGAAEARGEVLCFLDADTAPEPDYVRALTRLPALVPETVAVGRRRHADLAQTDSLHDAPAHELPGPGWLRDGYAATRDLLDSDDRAYRYVISAVLACTRWFFHEVGGFGDFDVYGGEDWEWAHRAWRAGGVFAHVRDAVAWHDGPDWGARGDPQARRRQKNTETRRLADLIAVPGSRWRSLRPRRTEILVRLDDVGSETQALMCVDGLLGALPTATVIVPAAIAAACRADGRVRSAAVPSDPDRDRPALELTIHRPVEVDGAALRAVCAEVRRDMTARLILTDGDGALLTLADGRGLIRARRWQDAGALAGVSRSAAGCAVVLEPDPDLEAWVGGWANPRLPPPSGGS